MYCYVHLAGAKTPTGLISYRCAFPRWVDDYREGCYSLGKTGQEESSLAARGNNANSSVMTKTTILLLKEAEITLQERSMIRGTTFLVGVSKKESMN